MRALWHGGKPRSVVHGWTQACSARALARAEPRYCGGRLSGTGASAPAAALLAETCYPSELSRKKKTGFECTSPNGGIFVAPTGRPENSENIASHQAARSSPANRCTQRSGAMQQLSRHHANAGSERKKKGLVLGQLAEGTVGHDPPPASRGSVGGGDEPVRGVREPGQRKATNS